MPIIHRTCADHTVAASRGESPIKRDRDQNRERRERRDRERAERIDAAKARAAESRKAQQPKSMFSLSRVSSLFGAGEATSDDTQELLPTYVSTNHCHCG